MQWERVCDTCKNSYLASVANQRYCSDACRPYVQNVKKQCPLFCTICNRKFIPLTECQRTCSAKCRSEAARRRLLHSQNRRGLLVLAPFKGKWKLVLQE